MNEFSDAIKSAFEKTKALLWPVRKLLWLQLFILYISTGSCNVPFVNIPHRLGLFDNQDASAAKTEKTTLNIPETLENLKHQAQEYRLAHRQTIYAGVAVIGLLFILFILVSIWVFCRLQMVTIKSLYEGRVEMGKFWHETRAAGQSYFTFNLWVSALFMGLSTLMLTSGGALYHGIKHSVTPMIVSAAVVMTLLGSSLVVSTIIFGAFIKLMPILMVRDGDSWRTAWGRLWQWFRRETKKTLAWLFFYVVLSAAVGIALALVALIAILLVSAPLIVAAIFYGMHPAMMGIVVLTGLSFLYLFVLVSLVWVGIGVPSGTFFTYLRMELMERALLH